MEAIGATEVFGCRTYVYVQSIVPNHVSKIRNFSKYVIKCCCVFICNSVESSCAINLFRNASAVAGVEREKKKRKKNNFNGDKSLSNKPIVYELCLAESNIFSVGLLTGNRIFSI